MEATVLKKRKTTISKGIIKKTIKNVICKPDTLYWPTLSEKEEKELEALLIKYRIDIPHFKKLHWNELKNIPKNERPKPPSVKKAEGFIFGISECSSLLENNQVAALILEAAINPRTIAQTLLQVCDKNQVPVVCLAGLRQISAANFGISTSCLGLKRSDLLTDLIEEIKQISSHCKPSGSNDLHLQNINQDTQNNNINDKDSPEISSSVPCYTYLYRTNKKRVFVPDEEKPGEETIVKKQFVGQNFIELPKKLEQVKDSTAYKKMLVKRISNNPNRPKKKK